MIERTGILILTIITVIIALVTASFNLSFYVFALCFIASTYVIMSLILPSISRFFKLVRKNRHEWHLQKNIIPSLFLICTNSPKGALLKLYRDVKNSALPNALPRVPQGHTLILETHLFKPSMSAMLPIGFKYQIIKPKISQVLFAKLVMILSAIIRFINRKEHHETSFHTWYRLSMIRPVVPLLTKILNIRLVLIPKLTLLRVKAFS